MTNKIDIVGHRYARLLVIKEVPKPNHIKANGHRYFECKCDCGNMIITSMSGMRTGNTNSCGCYNKEIISKLYKGKPIKHYSGYNSWKSIIVRCFNKSNKDYKYYGGRGIKVCDRWLDPVNFAIDMGDRPPNHSIDRINHNGDYELSNCRWATAKQQGINKRNNRKMLVFGNVMTVSQIWQKYNIPESTLYNRLNSGMSPEDAVTKPARKRNPYVYYNNIKMTLKDASIITRIPQKNLRKKVDSSLTIQLK